MEHVHGDIRIYDKNNKLKEVKPIAEAMEETYNRSKKYNFFGVKKNNNKNIGDDINE